MAISRKKIRKHWRRGIKRFRRGLVYCLTILFQRAMVLLPLSWAMRIGAAGGVAAFHLLRSERHKTLENIDLAYGPALSAREREVLGCEVFRQAGRSAAEMAFLTAGRGGNLLDAVEVQGLEHFLTPLAEGRGVVALTAHFGNWELMAPSIVRRVPCEVGVVARALSNPGLDDLVVGTRRRHGARVFTRGRTGREYVRFLRERNVLGVLGDIDTSKGDGLFVNFFGRPAWTQSGIARLARMGRARIVPAFMFRDTANPGRHRLVIEPPLAEPPRDLPEEEWVREMTQRFTTAIEAAVRRSPGHWMWMHRRWRHQPSGAAASHEKESG